MWEIQPGKKQKMVWTCSRKCFWKWRSEDFVGCYEPIRHRNQGKKTRYVVVNKNKWNCAIIVIAIPGDIRVSEKEKEKIERYQELKREIKRMWNIRSIKVIPVVVGALGSTSKQLKKYIEELGVAISIALLQKAALLGTAGILRKVLDCR